MAKTPRRLDASDIDLDSALMEKARENARAKKARMLAEQELGISDDNTMVVKGPAPIPNEEMITLTLDMYPGAGDLRLDGLIYRHGQTITVTRRVAESVLEIIARGWRHQEEIDGKKHNFYKPRLAVLSGANL